MKSFSGQVRIAVKKGMKARIDPKTFEGRLHKGKEFIITGLPRDLCGTEVVSLNNLDGTRFSPSFDLSMLEITDTSTE